MKPVIEANFKPFESVRFRQNASLVSKDQLASKTASGDFPIPPESTSGSKLRDQFSGKHDLYPGYQTSF